MTDEHANNTTWVSDGSVPPWYGQGSSVSSKDMTVEEMLAKAELNWDVEKRPLFRKSADGKRYTQAKGAYELTRSTDNTLLSIVGEGYNPVQNHDAIDFMAKFAEAGQMNIEALGHMWHGRYIWALARVDKDFIVGGGKSEDVVQNYILLSSPHVIGKALTFQFASVRLRCWNMLAFNLGVSFQGHVHQAKTFRMPHSMTFDEEVRESATEALGLAVQQIDEMQEVTNKLAATPATPEQVESYFCEVLRFDPNDPDTRKKLDGSVREPQLLPKFREALESAPGQDIETAQGTLWGALNAVTNVVDYHQGRDRETALRQAWLRSGARMKRRALDLALQRAG